MYCLLVGARMIGESIIWPRSTAEVAYVSLAGLLAVLPLSASDDLKALTPTVAGWWRGALVQYDANLSKRFQGNKVTKVLAVQIAELPAESAFKIFSTSRFAHGAPAPALEATPAPQPADGAAAALNVQAVSANVTVSQA